MGRPKKVVKNSDGGSYLASIRILGKNYIASGYNVSDAISNLKPSGSARGMSVLTISLGNQKRDRILPPPFTARLFSKSKLMREIAIKNTSLLFDL